MSQEVASVEASQLLRAQRVATLQQQLQQGDFDPARYASTPRRRAEILAQVLTRVVSQSAMRRRLKSLGVSREYCGGILRAISVEGGGLDVRREDGTGQVVTGPGLDERLLEVFPELVPFTLRNGNYIAVGGATPNGGLENITAPFNITRPLAFSGTESWNLSGVSTFWAITKAEFDLTAVAGYVIPNNGAAGAPLVDVDAVFPYGSYHWDEVPLGSSDYECFREDSVRLEWPASGRVWIHDNAGDNSAETGPWTWTGTLMPVEGGCPSDFPPLPNWFAGGGNGGFLYITYEEGCDDCSLDVQVNSACDGTPVEGGVFDMDGAYECTQDETGGCTITGIMSGVYPWTWTKTGFETLEGEFECECGGGASAILLEVTPDGGCPEVDGGNIIVGVPNSAAALWEGPRSGAIQVGVPISGQLLVRARRQKPYPET